LALFYVRSSRSPLSEGAYRQVFTAELPNDETIIFKECQWNNEKESYDNEDYEPMRMDMLVAELFSSNRLFVDIYGFCALSMFSEYLPHGDIETKASPLYVRGNAVELKDADDVDPWNNLTASEKLLYALEMAEAIAFMHNYEGGVLVHDDIQLPQFLFTGDGHLKLNDFNRAEPMLYDEEHGEYCRYRNNPGHGDVSKEFGKALRAPGWHHHCRSCFRFVSFCSGVLLKNISTTP
jgi:serine/threonine protein kinase